MPEMRKSKAWITESCLQRFYSWNSATISSSIYDSNRYPQIRSIKGNRPQNISRGLQIILIISMPWPQLEWILSNHSFWPDDPAQQSLSCHFSHFACLPSYEGCTSKESQLDTFSPWRLLKKGSCAKLYAILWQKVEDMFVEAVSSISIHQIWILSTSDSQLKDSFPLYLCVPVSELRKN